ncbi:MAG TPA: endonuclease domain-containing protein [bacterium]|nr:endonuclease domain-containing protein [bacterium]
MSELKALARENRKNPTKAEERIWYELLQNKQMLGHRFLRQKPIGQFIADFYCAELKLVIEIDGQSHDYKLEHDEERTIELNKRGITVFRYTNDEVLQNLEAVRADLERRITSLSVSLSKI